MESEHQTMSAESANLDLEQLTEQTAEQVIFIVGAATADPKAAVMRLLRQILRRSQGVCCTLFVLAIFSQF